jgi:CBS domain-containing protein
MQAEPAMIEASASLTDASSVMRVNNVRHLPVTEDGRLVGIVSMRDLLARAL